jgi:hypothetical protein
MSRYASEEYIRDFQTRKIIGIVRTLHNGDVEAREFDSRKILGFYRKTKNTTTDFYGHMVAKGNCVTGLIYDNFNKKNRGK